MKHGVKRDRNQLTVSSGLPKDQVGKMPHAFVIPVQNYSLSALVSHLILLSPFNTLLASVSIASATASYKAFFHNAPPSSNSVFNLV